MGLKLKISTEIKNRTNKQNNENTKLNIDNNKKKY